jgi:hypothetical protein
MQTGQVTTIWSSADLVEEWSARLDDFRTLDVSRIGRDSGDRAANKECTSGPSEENASLRLLRRGKGVYED